MKTIIEKIQINAPIDEVWKIASDIEGIHNHFVGSKNSYCITDNKEGIGASRICELVNSIDPNGPTKLRETVVSWKKGESVELEAIPEGDGVHPFKKVLGGWDLKSKGDGTETSFHVTYEPEDGMTDDVVAKYEITFTGLCLSIVIGLKQQVETGKPLTPEDKLKIIQNLGTRN